MEQAPSIRPEGIHEFKIAAMSKTIAFPIDPWFHLGDPRFVLALSFGVIGLAWHLRSAKRELAARQGVAPPLGRTSSPSRPARRRRRLI